jgi:hypothetical protein
MCIAALWWSVCIAQEKMRGWLEMVVEEDPHQKNQMQLFSPETPDKHTGDSGDLGRRL